MIEVDDPLKLLDNKKVRVPPRAVIGEEPRAKERHEFFVADRNGRGNIVVVGEAWKLEKSGKVFLMNNPEAIKGRVRLNRIRNREFARWVEIPSRTKRSSNEGKLGEDC